MARVRRSRGRPVVSLSAAETHLLRGLLVQFDETLAARAPARSDDPLEAAVGIADGPAEPPVDPGLARLVPAGYRDDPEAAAELRRLTEPALLHAKIDAARRLVESLPERSGKVTLDGESAAGWIGTLNDLRLVLGTRLGVTEDGDPLGGHRRTAPRAAPYVIYHWLTALQDRLVDAVDLD